MSDPQSNVYATIGSRLLERPVIDYLDRPSQRSTAPEDLPKWAEGPVPADSREGLGVPLFEPGGPYLGMLTLMFATPQQPPRALRDGLVRLAPLIARAVSPMRSLIATASLVQGAAYGAVVFADGTTYPLPGLGGHPLLASGSPVVDIARQTLLAGQVYRSFMWPLTDALGSPGHARMTILASTEGPAFVLGTLLITPGADCEGLTRRELEVLGLVVNGLSNQQMARRLRVTPRTVAAHVEHLLQKLDVPTRTSAAVPAERHGCYVPQPL